MISHIYHAESIRVFDLDLTTRNVISMPANFRGVDMDFFSINLDGIFYIADHANDVVHVVDLKGNLLGNISVDFPTAVHVAGSFLYLVHNCRSTLTVYNAKNDNEVVGLTWTYMERERDENTYRHFYARITTTNSGGLYLTDCVNSILYTLYIH